MLTLKRINVTSTEAFLFLVHFYVSAALRYL